MTLAGVGRLTPTIQWKEFLAAGHMTGLDTVVVGQPEFFQQLERSLKDRSLDEWKTYCRWHLANAYAEQAGGKYDAEHFHFFGTIMNGTAEQRARWKRMLDQQEGYLGDALGQLYVEKYFSPHAKARYEKLTEDVFDAFRARIRNLDWMSQPTKERALRKLDAVTKKVGYPAKWKDYANYQVKRDSFLGNVIRGNSMAERLLHRQAPQTGRSHRVGDDAADLQRLLQPVEQRDRDAGRHLHPARHSRLAGRRRAGLRLCGGDHDRPRDHARLR